MGARRRAPICSDAKDIIYVAIPQRGWGDFLDGNYLPHFVRFKDLNFTEQ